MSREKTVCALVVVCALVSAAVVFASGSSEGAAAKPVTVKFASTAKWPGVSGYEKDGQYGDWEKYVAASFMKENPNVNVEVEIWPSAAGEYDKKFNLAITSDTLPDVLQIDAGSVMKIAYLGLTNPVDDYVTAKEDLYPSVWDTSLYKGKHHFVGFNMVVLGFGYNKKIFDGAGAGVPTDELRWWNDDQYFQALQKVKTAYPNVYGVNIHAKTDSTDFGWRSWFHAHGARWISEDGKKVTINSPEGLETFRYLKKLYDAGLTNPAPAATSDVDVWRSLFYPQKGASLPFLVMWYGRFLGSAEKKEVEFFPIHFAMQPGPKKSATVLFQGFALPKSPGSKDKAVLDASGKFMNYATSGERAKAAKAIMQMSSRKSVNETLYSDSTDAQVLFAPKLAPYAGSLDGDFAPGYTRMRTEWNQIMQKFWNKVLTPEQAVAEIQAKVQPILDEEWAKVTK